MPYTDTLDDLQRKYRKTYVYYKGKPIQILDFGEVNADEYHIIFSPVPTNRKEVLSPLGSQSATYEEKELIEIHVNSMLFNMGLTSTIELSDTKQKCLAASLFRAPKKQYKRSLSSENYILYNPVFAYIARSKVPIHVDDYYAITSDILQSLFNPVYPTLPQAIEFLKFGITIALSDKFFLALHAYKANCYLVGNQWGFVGELNQQREFQLYTSGCTQELKDYLYRTQQQAWKVTECLLQ